jgi:hypothetical protein
VEIRYNEEKNGRLFLADEARWGALPNKDFIAPCKYYLLERREYEQESLIDRLDLCDSSGRYIFLHPGGCLPFTEELQCVPFYHPILQAVADLYPQQGPLSEVS